MNGGNVMPVEAHGCVLSKGGKSPHRGLQEMSCYNRTKPKDKDLVYD